VRFAASPKVPMSGQIACRWRTKILFSVGDNLEFTIVDYESPTALDPDDRAVFQPLTDRRIGTPADLVSPVLSALIAHFLEEQQSYNAAETYSEIMSHFVE
jgi:hypothetical protein